MKTYHITYTEINSYPVEIEANSREEAQGKLYDNFSDYIDILRPDDTEIELEFAEEDEPNEEPLKTYDFIYRETWSGLFHIEAHSEEEATVLFEKHMADGIDELSLDQCDNTSWELLTRD